MTKHTATHAAMWRWLYALGGGVMVFLCILFSLGIWIRYFDNDGGEPGATTIFASIVLWPLFGLLIIAVGIACGFSRRLFLAVFAMTLVLFAWVFTLTLISRAENKKRWEQQRDKSAQELVIAMPDTACNTVCKRSS